LSTTVLVAEVRSVVQDLLQATGASEADALAAIVGDAPV
jgi:hypothetical protein